MKNYSNYARWMTSEPQMPDYTGTSFTNFTYTTLSTFPSRKISGLWRKSGKSKGMSLVTEGLFRKRP